MIDLILRTGRGRQASVVEMRWSWRKAAFITLSKMWSVCRYAMRILIRLIMCSTFFAASLAHSCHLHGNKIIFMHAFYKADGSWRHRQ